jgi:2-C-methyl-D-erythritol 4-phosphate cytidylyltransferase
MLSSIDPTDTYRVKTGAIVVAAGRGTRMGGGDKCARLLGGYSILRHSVVACVAAVDRVVVVVAPERVAAWHGIARREGWPPIEAIVGGGETRQASVLDGFEALLCAGALDLIAIHDGARPLVTEQLIGACLEAAKVVGAAIAAIPVTDTIKRVAECRVIETPDRSTLWAAQTPQAFRTATLTGAFAWAAAGHMPPFTDEAGLVEAFGRPVAIVPGDRGNIKVTEPTDHIIAAALLAARDGGDHD